MFVDNLHALAAEYHVRELDGIAELLIFIEETGEDITGTIIQLVSGTEGENVTIEMPEPFAYFSKFLINVDRNDSYANTLARLLNTSCWDIVDAVKRPARRSYH